MPALLQNVRAPSGPFHNIGAQVLLPHDLCRESISLACRWLIDRSLVTTPDHGINRRTRFEHGSHVTDWRGAFRGEYDARARQWDFFCPVWHGGQAIKALVMAAGLLDSDEYLETARFAAEFILRHQIVDRKDEDFGLILAYESSSRFINTSAIMESLDGLFFLSEATGDARYGEAAVNALRWVQRKMFLPEEGLFQDDYDLKTRTAQRASWMPAAKYPQPGRPLLDDAVFITGYRLTGDASLKDVAVRAANRLLLDEAPRGNWRAYPPCDPVTGRIHPRQTYWMGRPLWMLYRAGGDERYLDCCRRSAQWCVEALRSDGGFFRDTDASFKTPSFGQATSGSACAAIHWAELIREFGDPQWKEPLRLALNYCLHLQFTDAEDECLQGAILEKVMPPDGTDRPSWYLRDLSTIFYIQAMCLVVRDIPEVLE